MANEQLNVKYVDLQGLRLFAEELKKWLKSHVVETDIYKELLYKIENLALDGVVKNGETQVLELAKDKYGISHINFGKPINMAEEQDSTVGITGSDEHITITAGEVSEETNLMNLVSQTTYMPGVIQHFVSTGQDILTGELTDYNIITAEPKHVNVHIANTASSEKVIVDVSTEYGIVINGKTYVKDVGNFDGENPTSTNDLATYIKSLETRIQQLENIISQITEQE